MTLETFIVVLACNNHDKRFVCETILLTRTRTINVADVDKVGNSAQFQVKILMEFIYKRLDARVGSF